MNAIDSATKLRGGRLIGFFVTVALPSVALFEKIGLIPLLGLLLASAGGVWFFVAALAPWFSKRTTSREMWLALAGLHAGLLAAYLLIHPFIDTEGFLLLGTQLGASDADDAIDVALAELLAGHYPYRARTFLDNPITPLPGSLLLALPFSLAGDSGLQNPFWLATFFGWIGRIRDPATSTWLALAAFGLCPVLGYQVLQGTDYVSNAIYVWFFSALLLRSVAAKAPRARRVLWSCLLGIALSSRLNFLVTTPLLFLALKEFRSWKEAMREVLPCAITFCCLTIPFYLVDPNGFSPLHTASKLNRDGSLPWLQVGIPALGLTASALLGVRSGAADIWMWSRNTFSVQIFLVLAAAAGATFATGQLTLRYGHFCVLAMPFGLVTFGVAALQRRDAVYFRTTTTASRQLTESKSNPKPGRRESAA